MSDALDKDSPTFDPLAANPGRACALGKNLIMTVSIFHEMTGRNLHGIEVVHALAHIMAEVLTHHDGEVVEADAQGLIGDDERIQALVDMVKAVTANNRQAAEEAKVSAQANVPEPNRTM